MTDQRRRTFARSFAFTLGADDLPDFTQRLYANELSYANAHFEDNLALSFSHEQD